jgi:phenylalanyl-tRNA synthetase beta chain
MKFPLSWLKEHLETDASLDQIVDTLTAVGLEVEEVTDRAKDLAPFTVAYVIEAVQHPDADRLRVLTVDTGNGTTQVVCGAPNARTGMKGVFADVGVTIPGNGMLLAPAKIRGVESKGMLCSEREMGLSDEHDGIIDLPEDAPIGEPFAKLAGLDDPIIEIAITPNHQDALGVAGIARDLAAAGLGKVITPDAEIIPGTFESPIKIEMKLGDDAADACPYFVGRYVRGLKNGPSPKWLQDRLLAIGLRPISALVDMTNYITFDMGRPLHVFDADKVAGNIHLRLAKSGESIDALNDKSYDLDDEMTAVCDDNGVLGLGGVIGGVPSGCTEDTVNVFIEAALFDPIRTATTGRKLQVDSDARYRFERGIDPAAVVSGMERATKLVLDICGGEASEITSAGAQPDWNKTVSFRPARMQTLGGLDTSPEQSISILESLGFGIEENKGDTLEVSVPTWRMDVHGEADLVEEVARIVGYDAIPAIPLRNPAPVTRPSITPQRRQMVTAKRVLASRGMNEAVTWSFTQTPWAEMFGGGADALRLANPISSDIDIMRPSTLPNLIDAVKRNVDRGVANVCLFEVGNTYSGVKPDEQQTVAGGVRRGENGQKHWSQAPRDVDVFDAKADAMAVLAEIGAPVSNLQTFVEAPDWYHPGRSGTLRLGPKTILAAFGELHPRVLAGMDVKGPLVGFEVLLDNLPKSKAKASHNRSALVVSDLPAVDRDFAFVVGQDVAAQDIVRAAKGADRKLIIDVAVFDVFEGASLGEDKKSIAIRVRLQPADKTLTEDEIDAVADRVVGQVAKATGGALRG